MSYLVLARKWRPQSFEDVVGQPHVTKTLQNAVRSNRIAHAYLFTGARGVGKTSVARILAKTLNCEQANSAQPCNQCSNCREITQGNSVDVLEIDGASNRGIDNIRELRETVRYRPAKGRYKIYIIDEVHMLTTEAFNALLKTLEEPPEHVLFIFATTEPHKIPSTILSRCQRFDFRRIPIQQIVKHLKSIVVQEKVGISDGVIYAVAREADGSMRDSQSLLEQLLAFSGDGLSDEEILDVLGVVDRRSVHRVGQAILAGDVRTCLEVVSDLYRRGIDSRRFCQQLCDHFRNLLFLALGESEGSVQLDLPEEERKLLREEVSKTNSDSLYLYFQMILKGEEEIRRSSLPRIGLEMLLLRLAQLPRLESLASIMEKLTSLENRLASDPNTPLFEQPRPLTHSGIQAVPRQHRVQTVEQARRIEHPAPALGSGLSAKGGSSSGQSKTAAEEIPPGPAQSADQLREPVVGMRDEPRAPSSEPTVVASDPPVLPSAAGEAVERWPRFLQWLQNKDPVLAAKLNQSHITLISETEMELEVLEVFENMLREAQSLAKLTSAAGAFFGRQFEWVVHGRSTMHPESRDSQKQKTPKASSKRLVLEHPVVQQALEILGGELLEIRTLKSDGAGKIRGSIPAEPADGSDLT
jgi:DNA polymerase-3 subunit gamma/tau